MLKNLVIVESPAKAKTIGKFLGKNFKVMSSYGHIRDLKKKGFGIDVAHDFTPDYEVPVDKRKVVSDLMRESSKAEIVWLASDEDREGEAISWHLYEVLNLNQKATKRIVFHEITETAILHAIESPRSIDLNLVNAQQARRVLDRIVGFELSPVLWRKVKPALSAGRVQSVTVRLIVDREREINSFQPERWFKVSADFAIADPSGNTHNFKAELSHRLHSLEEAQALLESFKDKHFCVSSIETKPVKRSPAPPFTTSTLQQEAARKLGYPVAQTMRLAQMLYEAGHITYMRTDSVNLSTLALAACRELITAQMGENYLKTRNFTTKTKGAQEAHEAIRPTDMKRATIEGTPQEKRLYELIWKRTLASQMSEAIVDKTSVTIAKVQDTAQTSSPDASQATKDSNTFVATGEVLRFDGFLRVYNESHDNDDEPVHLTQMLPKLEPGQIVDCQSVSAIERYTQQPPRYSEASLVKKLEELGIGRPSTYAPTISTIQQREYVTKGDSAGKPKEFQVLTLSGGTISHSTKSENTGGNKGKLIPTDTGIVVNDFLTEYFPKILDYNFTANIEMQLDEVAEGKVEWKHLMSDFYQQFHPSVESAMSVKTEHKIGERVLGCDPSGKQVSVKIGRFGPMVQVGSADDDEKPKFASLQKGQSIETITLDQALELFKLPRVLGVFEESEVQASTGRYGPYVRHKSKFYSLPKDADPLETTLEEAIAAIEAKRAEDANRIAKTFPEEPGLEVINGRYGPYISYNKTNYKLPKGIDLEQLDLDKCKEIIKEQDAKPAAPKRRYPRRSKK